MSYQEFDHESQFGRKKSLVRPERSRIDENHPRYHYTQVAQQESSHLKIQPSTTGMDPKLPTTVEESPNQYYEDSDEGIPLMDIHGLSPGKDSDDLKMGREVYGLNDESPKKPTRNVSQRKVASKIKEKEKSDLYPWKVYCYAITFWAPAPLLKLFGIRTRDAQFAWREKMGLISVICCLGAIVAFITFGFTRTVCLSSRIRIRNNEVNSGNLIINGRFYDLTGSQHPAAAGIGAGLNILYPPINAGGKDASFLFQNVNGNCKGLITKKDDSNIPSDGDNLAWYMPCRVFDQDGSTSPNTSEVYYNGWACHTSSDARDSYYGLKVGGDVYFTWDDIRNSLRNLVVYSGNVLDLNLIDWISLDLNYPDLFNRLKNETVFRGHDISLVLTEPHERQAARCLTEIIKVGTVDSDTIGCLASDVVLWSSLVFILSVVISKFVMACYFRWWIANKQGVIEDNKSMAERDRMIENWVDDNNPEVSNQTQAVPLRARANYKENKTNRQSVFNRVSNNPKRFAAKNELSQYYNSADKLSKTFEYTTMTTQAALLGGAKKLNRASSMYLNDASSTDMLRRSSGEMLTRKSSNDLLGTRRNSVDLLGTRRNSIDMMNRSSTDLLTLGGRPASTYSPFELHDAFPVDGLSAEIIHPSAVPQPPVEYQPHGYPLIHTMVVVTCYSEDEEGIRTTLDSVATTDYPNSHKLIVVVCDGIIKGSGNDMSTPDIMLGMMNDFAVPVDEVKPYSYVAVAQGSKRHNMAKVYAGFYKYNDETVPPEKQQRVPVITIVKCGTPDEAVTAKPGNRGKRDSQIVIMSFLQKVMFDERMTELEFEMLKSIWRVTGLMAEFYETLLFQDADSKTYPDALTHLNAEFVRDPMIMGLCGETKIANKLGSWVTTIQVFEYYISHHQAKAFESVFGGVTCLPGCFCMYRIKAPKGKDGFWVPILANPDIVERYSDNVTDTLHRKNLLLLGEDRYLTSLMLRTFPKRSQIFVPKAICKTIVPDTFKVLLSQRRRWINSTVHNLMELVQAQDLCGTFCFSMQFVIAVELIGTLVLPAAITLTIYVIIFAIVSHPTPVMSLVLLGVVFGLPGTLIVITVSSWSYIVYFFIYLLALPIWNFVLPVYAFWKFDDFSWGETRVVQGGDKGDHSAAEGKFDSSQIVMKRWREYERDRRGQEQQQQQLAGLTVPGAAWNPSEKSETYSDEGRSE